MNYVYIVTVRPKNILWEDISQVGYETLTDAQKFIESREDSPVQFNKFRYEGHSNYYNIYEIEISKHNKGESKE